MLPAERHCSVWKSLTQSVTKSGVHLVGDEKVIQQNDMVRFVTEKTHFLQFFCKQKVQVKSTLSSRQREGTDPKDTWMPDEKNRKKVPLLHIFTSQRKGLEQASCAAAATSCTLSRGTLAAPGWQVLCSCSTGFQALADALWRRPVSLQLCLVLVGEGGDALRSDSRVTWGTPRLHSCCVLEPYSLKQEFRAVRHVSCLAHFATLCFCPFFSFLQTACWEHLPVTFK